MRDTSRKGNNISEEIRIDENNTGITAFSCTDTFLLTSYEPSSKADIIPRKSHIIYLVNV
jgi:hypothetical protein